jgi:hypothetical protein
MRRFIRFTIAGLVAVLLAGGAAAQERFEESGAFAADGSVSIDILNGSVTLTTWDKDEIVVRGTVEGGREYLEISRDGSHLDIEFEGPDNDGWSGRRSWDGRLDVEIQAPAGIRFELDGVNAEVELRGMSGDVEVDLVNGNVHVDGSPGEVEVDLVNGRVTVEGARGPLSLETVSGSIEVTGPAERVSAESVSGTISIAGETLREIDMESVSGNLVLSGSPASSAEIDLESHSGNVTLRVPGNVSAEFEVETFSGDVINEHGPEARRVDRYSPGKELSFRAGSGSAEIRIATFSGTVRIETLD